MTPELQEELDQLELYLYKLQHRMTYYGEAVTPEELEHVINEVRRVIKKYSPQDE